MITEAFQIILKYVAPGQENIVIQNVCNKYNIKSFIAIHLTVVTIIEFHIVLFIVHSKEKILFYKQLRIALNNETAFQC
jgi:hypothetical protein